MIDSETDQESSRRDVERAIEAFLGCGGHFKIRSALGSVDAGYFGSLTKVKRDGRVVTNDAGVQLRHVLPKRDAVQIIRSRRRGGCPSPETEREVGTWLSSIEAKIARLTADEQYHLVGAARLRNEMRQRKEELKRIEADLGSVTGRKRMAKPQGKGIEWSQSRRAWLRRYIDTLSRRRRSIVHSQVYANAWTMFALVCAVDRDSLAYCLRLETTAP